MNKVPSEQIKIHQKVDWTHSKCLNYICYHVCLSFLTFFGPNDGKKSFTAGENKCNTRSLFYKDRSIWDTSFIPGKIVCRVSRQKLTSIAKISGNLGPLKKLISIFCHLPIKLDSINGLIFTCCGVSRSRCDAFLFSFFPRS